MKKYFLAITFIAACFSAVLSSCSKDNLITEPQSPYTKIAESFANGTKVELHSTAALTVGYNPVYIALYDSATAQRIEHATVTLQPVMDMGTMKHAAPAENPSAHVGADKYFTGALIFTMPSGGMGGWTVEVSFARDGKWAKVTLPISVGTSSVGRLKSFVSKADGSKFFVALLQPSAPKVGVNDAEFAIYKSKSMMEYPADSTLSITITPEMPTMGHGSPNNINPTHATNGHHKGKVNFTMTGLWYLHLDFSAGSTIADSTTFFEVSF